jgi:Ty3 transposon capsid-like protein
MDDQPAQEVSAEQVMAEIWNMQTQIQNLQLQLQTAQQALLQHQPVAAIPAPQPTHVKYSDDRPLTRDDFKESITNHFESSRKVEDPHEKLLTLRQEGSVSRYVSAFQTQLHLFGDMAERDKVLYFKWGLRTYTQAHVRVQDPQTLSEAIKIAESADQRSPLFSSQW